MADTERFAKHLANEFPAVFLFLCDPSIEATNWRAEQAIRPAVVTRKVCGGNRTRRGGPTRSRCWPAWCAPPANASSTCPTWSPRCCAPRTRSYLTHWHCRRPPEAGRLQRPFRRPRPAGGSPGSDGSRAHERPQPSSPRPGVRPAEPAVLPRRAGYPPTFPERLVADARKRPAAYLPPLRHRRRCVPDGDRCQKTTLPPFGNFHLTSRISARVYWRQMR